MSFTPLFNDLLDLIHLGLIIFYAVKYHQNDLFLVPYQSCNLESAIHTAYDLRRMRFIDSTSYMFILTDGLYQKNQKDSIRK